MAYQQSTHEGWRPIGEQTIYAPSADNIPLQDDKERLNRYQNRMSANSIYHIKQNKLSLFAVPVINIIISLLLAIALLLLFLRADQQLLDYTILSMKIPTLISLLLSVYLIFVGSGISTAVAEYKWVKLQNGTPLTTIDVYDGCANGLSGFLMTLRARNIDTVLIVVFIFHLGFLALSPASQAILVPYNSNYTASDGTVRFYYYHANDTISRSNLGDSGQPPLMNGLSHQAYLTSYSFAQAAVGAKFSPMFLCPDNALTCIFNDTQYISTSMICESIPGSSTAIVNHNNGTTRTVVVLDEYYTNLNISATQMNFPKFLYSSDMLGRTYYDLANYTQPMMPGLNIPLTQASSTVYDPQYRPYVGDQIVVMAYDTNDPKNNNVQNYTQLSYKKCTLQSYMNTSTWQTSKGTLQQVSVESSERIIFDYDNVLGNNTALSWDNIASNFSVGIMINAYVMQQAILYELTTPKYYFMSDYLFPFNTLYASTRYSLSDIVAHAGDFAIFEEFMKVALQAFDYSFFQAPFVSHAYQTLEQLPHQGVASFNLQARYKVNKANAFALCLCLIPPIVWWLVVWLISLKKMGGVARGSSQIALLAAGLTPEAEHTLRGFSELDDKRAFKRGRKTEIRLGLFKENVTFGMANEKELHPLNK